MLPCFASLTSLTAVVLLAVQVLSPGSASALTFHLCQELYLVLVVELEHEAEQCYVGFIFFHAIHLKSQDGQLTEDQYHVLMITVYGVPSTVPGMRQAQYLPFIFC